MYRKGIRIVFHYTVTNSTYGHTLASITCTKRQDLGHIAVVLRTNWIEEKNSTTNTKSFLFCVRLNGGMYIYCNLHSYLVDGKYNVYVSM